ncbi:uncharacterized protein LOC131307269 isoform X4 [Rhododendron vialii]|uniref:uncharacterized protein LOC131307269 isoform X4 n=1 Tax=Rhododendron vialii TaxID=182163 RepID=UPI00265F6072|nr:uncharacterized protein LOC131307269 isoform X4 [Rhododendron vialii]
MYIQPRHLSKMLTSYERLKQKKMDQNLVQLRAAGVKNVPKFLLGLNQSANIKVNDKEEVDIGCAVDGDEDVVLFDGEERLCSNNDNDDPSGSKTNEVNGTCPRNKKDCSSAQPLRKSQRTQEQGGSTQGATQAQQLPTSPTEQPDLFCSPHTVVGCVETPASPSRTSQNLKRKRGPTKLKTIAIDGSSRIEVKFDGNGEPIGEGSVKLSSFLGPLVREIVPYTLKDWRKLPSAMAEILWQSIKVKSENFKAMREKQLELQHTMSRKGYARLTAELEDMGKIERNGQNSTNLKEDAVSKVLGAERNGRVRTFGKGVTQTRLTILSQMNGQFAELRKENAQMKSQMSDMRNTIDEFKKSQVQNPATTEATSTTPLVSPSVTCHPQSDITKCKLLDWMGTGDVVAEGRWASSDPHSCAHCVPIGPNAMKVWVDVAKKPEEFLWRAPSDMTYIVDAVGSTIAWPADFVILDSSSPGFMG